MREPVRDQIELRAVDLDSLIDADHSARLFWDYVQKLDLSAVEGAIKARVHTPGQAPPSSRLLLAVWLYAVSEGVGSARALARLCESHDAYRWLCGGVSVNYHTLSDFRVDHAALLDELLANNVAALAAAGVIDLDTLAQDGLRVRAAAGAASFRRRKTVEKHLRQAKRVVARLKQELDDDPDASSRRAKAAKDRAAREREDRVADALDKLGAIEAQRARRAKTNAKATAKQGPPRVSTTDPDARIIKLPAAPFRPPPNIPLAPAAQHPLTPA